MRPTSWLASLLSSVALLACNAGTGSTTEATTSTMTTEVTSGSTTGDDTTTGDATTGDATTGDATTGAPTTGDTTGAPGGYCWGFQVNAPAPYLELYDLMDGPLGDGATLALECGVQGLWMFGLYPRLGGWDPQATSVSFSLTVDVEGFNINPAGHFFSGEVGYYIGCEVLDGGVPGVIPILPPDELADLAALDGLPAMVHVEIAGGGETVTFDATMPLSAPQALVEQGCVFGP